MEEENIVKQIVTGYSGVNKPKINNCIRRFTHSNVKIKKRKNIVTDKIIQVQ